jgi:hypothetical protein
LAPSDTLSIAGTQSQLVIGAPYTRTIAFPGFFEQATTRYGADGRGIVDGA